MASRARLLWALPLLGLAAAWAVASPPANAQDLAVRAVADTDGASLGRVAVPAECAAEAMPPLDRGVALLHNMTYDQAEEAFQSALDADGTCTLAYWGRAMAAVHPLWPDVPSDADFARGQALLEEARARGPVSEREDAYLTALEAYYHEGPTRTEPERLARFAAGWERALERFPSDPEIRLFRALSLIAVAPAAPDPVAAHAAAGEMAEAVLQEIPDHTGALHYIIHAYDLPELAERALPAARVYGEIAPENHHALHMTSHIFTRVGLWDESMEYNRRSAAAALHHPVGTATSFHYLHAADYLVYAALQRLDDADARAVWDAMVALEGPIYDHLASAYPFAAVPARLALERQAWAEARDLRLRWPATIAWDHHPQAEAITVFARGLGAARTGDLAAAEAALARLGELQAAAAALPGPYDWGTQVRVQALTVGAWTAFADGRTDEALARMREAAALESSTQKNPVTPGEVLPAAELLGDMLLALDQPAAAAAAYVSALERSPNRLNSLYGAGRAAEALGDRAQAAAAYRQLLAMASPGAQHAALAHARTVLPDD